MTALALLMLGQSTHDHVVPAEPGPWRPQMGGNALFAAAALTVLPPERIAVVTRCGRDYPFDIEGTLAGVGIRRVAVVEVDVPHLVEWLVYEPDGTRRSLPRNPDLRGTVGEGADASLAYLARLEALSPTAGDVPSAWRAVAKIDLASRVAARHRANAEVFAAGARVILDPSPHCGRTGDAPALRAMLPTVDALLASEGDIAALVARHGTPALAAEAPQAAGFSEVVVKRDARGCEVATSAGPRTMPAPTTRMVDPTGAGDAFGGAFAAARAVGADMFPGAEAALRAGALAVGVASAADALDAAARATR